MGFREKLQIAARKVSGQTHEVIEGVREKSDIAAKTLDAAGKSGKAAYKGVTKSVGWVVSKGAERIGADKYRDELDAALQEALRVISVQEERIALLEGMLVQGNRD